MRREVTGQAATHQLGDGLKKETGQHNDHLWLRKRRCLTKQDYAVAPLEAFVMKNTLWERFPQSRVHCLIPSS